MQLQQSLATSQSLSFMQGQPSWGSGWQTPGSVPAVLVALGSTVCPSSEPAEVEPEAMLVAMLVAPSVAVGSSVSVSPGAGSHASGIKAASRKDQDQIGRT